MTEALSKERDLVDDYPRLTRYAPDAWRRAAVAGAPRTQRNDRPATTDVRTAQVTPGRGALIDPIRRRTPRRLPCQAHDEDLWFASEPSRLERAKKLCTSCPVLRGCLAGAVQREEPAGVWGGQIFDHGRIVAFKRPRGRPRKSSADPHATFR